jgi:hypothetical protein
MVEIPGGDGAGEVVVEKAGGLMAWVRGLFHTERQMYGGGAEFLRWLDSDEDGEDSEE